MWQLDIRYWADNKHLPRVHLASFLAFVRTNDFVALTHQVRKQFLALYCTNAFEPKFACYVIILNLVTKEQTTD